MECQTSAEFRGGSRSATPVFAQGVRREPMRNSLSALPFPPLQISRPVMGHASHRADRAP